MEANTKVNQAEGGLTTCLPEEAEPWPDTGLGWDRQTES